MPFLSQFEMIDSYLKPDYIFETSWEVCNKMGGIHTVLSTKALTLVQQFQDKLIFIGPDVWRGTQVNPEFLPDDSLFPEWKAALLAEGLRVKTGRWKIVGRPIVVLIDFSPFIANKNEIFASLWENFKVDSLSGQWDYIEAALFGYAVGRIVESFYRVYLSVGQKVIAHFNEWMTGTGGLYLKKALPQVGVIFTTHATVVGRSIAGNGLPLYDPLQSYDGDVKAQDFNVISKHSVEKLAALHADCFTTVSDITAKECAQLLQREVDVVTPNGFEEDFVPQGENFYKCRDRARMKLRQVAEALLGYRLSDNALFIANSGRYEYKNKGIDVFLDSIKNLNEDKDVVREIVAFILIPANTYGPRKDLIEKLNNADDHTLLENPFITHGLNDLGYDPIMNKIQDIYLNNDRDDRVKLIFVPSYLNGDDGIFNLHYYDILIGMDLTVFPSYYEPWGYTPLESLAFSIPTITTDLAGFGIWSRQFSKSIEDGIEVLVRNDGNDYDVGIQIASIIKRFAVKSQNEIEIIRAKAKQISATAEWDALIKFYYKAFDIALNAVANRKEKFNTVPKEAPIKILPEIGVNPIWKKLIVKSRLPERIMKLQELSRNLWWSWNYQAIELFEVIDPELWEMTKKNPVSFIERVSFERLEQLSKDEQFIRQLDDTVELFHNYMERKSTHEPVIAYFSMEYGLTDVLKIFSGGLGILAGDYLKEASDSGYNMVGVGLLYRYGYFKQTLSINGEQMAHFDAQEFSSLPVEEVKNSDGSSLLISINFPGRMVHAKVWKVSVGRVPLYLLDTDHAMNGVHDREITHKLYGGDWENRLKQEFLLGIGGIRLLNALGIECDLYHCNEGHAALINVQRMVDLCERKFGFQEALELVKSTSLFTTHTPVPAGHDKFDEDMFRVYLRHIPEKLNISWDEFMSLGRENINNKNERFSMSVLAAKTSQEVNGVSWLHGEVSKDMFVDLWHGYFPEELHVGYVTNGVHYGTWTAKEWRKFYESEFDDDFLSDLSHKKYWERIQSISDERIWKIRTALRKKLLAYVKSRIDETMVYRHEDPSRIVAELNQINDKALTIGFARRFATYKRAHLLFTDTDRLSKIVNNPDRPVQFIFAGKAHPADGGGQGLIKHIFEISRRPEFIGKIIFLENYDMELAKKLVSGVDIWMNTPTRPLEASGTSGQKAELNGVLNFSVLDGWWYEGYREGAGWALTDKRTYENQEFQDELDAATIYSIFENEIVPLFYDQDSNGISKKWIQYVKNSIADIAPEFTTKRMIDDYYRKFYSKLYNRSKSLMDNDCAKARELALWKRRISLNWSQIEVVKISIPDISNLELGIGDRYRVEVILDLKRLNESEIGLELVFADAADDDKSKILHIEEFNVKSVDGSRVVYALDHKLNLPGVFKFGIRMFPKNPDLPHKQDFCMIRWI